MLSKKNELNKTIKVTNGTSFLELKLNTLGSYLKFKKPLAINWSDCQGSIAQFYAIFSYLQEYKESIQESLRVKLNDGSFDLNSEIDEVSKLLSLFENGTYNISFEPEYQYKISDNWNWNLAKNNKLFSSNAVIREETQTLYSDENKNLDYLTESYYNGYSEYFIFTQPSEVLNKERIKFYQEKIIQGEKPTAIIYNGYSETKGTYKDGSNWIRTYLSGDFIIDGHHKLMAYKKLNCAPSLLRISKIYNSDDKLNFSMKDFKSDLASRLLKCQSKHFTENYKKYNCSS